MKTVSWTTATQRERVDALARPALANSQDRSRTVASIIEAVSGRGDEALIELTAQYDGVNLTSLLATDQEFERALDDVDPRVLDAIDDARVRIESFHAATRLKPVSVETAPGVVCERVVRPLSPVGLYVPAGSAPLPSTALMLCVPAQLAGCDAIWIATPPNDRGEADPHVLAVAAKCGVRNVLKVGGAQAIAALACGTQSVPACLKIFGPGNAWVTEAKQQVSRVPRGPAIDMPAGPSEVMVVADQDADPVFVASDLLSQCEHGPDSHAVLVSDSGQLISAVEKELERQTQTLSREPIVRLSLQHAVAIETANVSESIDVANRYAAEHLILQIENADEQVQHIRAAGSVFVGAYSPEAIGDYCSGTNHVLPTYGYAQNYSGVSCDSFTTTMTVQRLSAAGLQAIGETARTLAQAEGLDAHAAAVSVRLAALENSP